MAMIRPESYRNRRAAVNRRRSSAA